MSTLRRRILVVSESLPLANTLLVWLREAGYDPAVVTTFSAGKEHLRTAPDILITELKLREYNGLHLALRAHREGIPTAVIGAPDLAFADDAQALGASYLVADTMDRDDILLLIDGFLSARSARAADSRASRWVGTPITDSPAAAEKVSDSPWQGGPLTNSYGDEFSSPGKVVVH